MTTRRRFLRMLGLCAAALVALPARLAHAKKLAFKLTKVKKLEKVDGSAVIKLKGQKILFIRDTETSIRAVDPYCTHRRCEVAYSPKNKRIQCACHGSAYDLDGKVLQPPTRAPLKTYPASLKDGKVIVDLGS